MACGPPNPAASLVAEETKEALHQTLGAGIGRPKGLESRPAARTDWG
jgi:hypothetical protein